MTPPVGEYKETMMYRHRSFDGKRVYECRQTLTAQMFRRWPAGDVTAWQMAKILDALGSTVSSLVFKLAKRGRLIRTGGRSKHGGQLYRRVNLEQELGRCLDVLNPRAATQETLNEDYIERGPKHPHTWKSKTVRRGEERDKELR